jgi:formamidopyrimidine-DNA glycosylase
MPELPDVELYIHALRTRIVGHELQRVRIGSPFLLRTFEPTIEATYGKTVRDLRRMGKRIVWAMDDELFVVIHLMIAGRLRWKPPDAAITRKGGLAAFDFAHGTLVLTEAGSRRRASLHVVRGEDALEDLNPAGLEVLDASVDQFAETLTRDNHTLKRALTDPYILSGIGNAYSDEILHAAKLSPMQLTTRLTADEIARLYGAARQVLSTWRDRLIEESGDAFPEKVTAFRPGMAAHGKFGKPCPVCSAPIQRIRYADNEANYCPTCQTGGRLLADRALSRLLKDDWPRSLEALEAHRRARRL